MSKVILKVKRKGGLRPFFGTLIGTFAFREVSGAFYVKDKKGNKEEKAAHATPCHKILIPDLKIDPIIISWKSCLFLGSSSLLSLDPSTLLLATLVAGLAAGVTQLAVGSLLALGEVGALDLSDGLTLVEVVDGEDGTDAGGVALGLALGGESSLGSVDLLGGRVKLLELTALAGEEDQAGLVVLETGDIGDERLLGVVDTAVVNGDTDGTGELLGDTSFLSDSKKIRRELPSDIQSNSHSIPYLWEKMLP